VTATGKQILYKVGRGFAVGLQWEGLGKGRVGEVEMGGCRRKTFAGSGGRVGKGGGGIKEEPGKYIGGKSRKESWGSEAGKGVSIRWRRPKLPGAGVFCTRKREWEKEEQRGAESRRKLEEGRTTTDSVMNSDRDVWVW